MQRLVLAPAVFFVALALVAAPPAPATPPHARPSARPSPAPTTAPKPLNEVKTESGLIYRDLVVGKGAQPKEGQSVTIHYVGRLAGGGRVFDSSYRVKRPLTFTLGDRQVIKGMEEGVSSMRVGGRRILIIPPELGYRDEIVGSIPPDSTLEFDVQLLEVK